MLKLHLESLCFSLLVILFLKSWYILGSKENTIRIHVYCSKKENVFHCFCGFMGPNRPYQKLLAFKPLVTRLTCSRVLWRTFMCENMTAPASHTAKSAAERGNLQQVLRLHWRQDSAARPEVVADHSFQHIPSFNLFHSPQHLVNEPPVVFPASSPFSFVFPLFFLVVFQHGYCWDMKVKHLLQMVSSSTSV